MDSGKLVIGDDEFDVYICDGCGEHEAQIKVFDGFICFQCWCSRGERIDDEAISSARGADLYPDEEIFD